MTDTHDYHPSTLHMGDCSVCGNTRDHQNHEIPGKLEMYEGKLRKVVDASRTGWWRFHEHYDRNGYCDNPSRGY
jgi:hypothetical protein